MIRREKYTRTERKGTTVVAVVVSSRIVALPLLSPDTNFTRDIIAPPAPHGVVLIKGFSGTQRGSHAETARARLANLARLVSLPTRRILQK